MAREKRITRTITKSIVTPGALEMDKNGNLTGKALPPVFFNGKLDKAQAAAHLPDGQTVLGIDYELGRYFITLDQFMEIAEPCKPGEDEDEEDGDEPF